MLKVEHESTSFSKKSPNNCWLLFCQASGIGTFIGEQGDGSMHWINNLTTINKKTNKNSDREFFQHSRLIPINHIGFENR